MPGMPGFESLEYQVLWVDFLCEFWEIMIPFTSTGDAPWSTRRRPEGFCSRYRMALWFPPCPATPARLAARCKLAGSSSR